ncbi:hypothetical protein ACFL59_07810, partial [Planctomycetota bacterium]
MNRKTLVLAGVAAAAFLAGQISILLMGLPGVQAQARLKLSDLASQITTLQATVAGNTADITANETRIQYIETALAMNGSEAVIGKTGNVTFGGAGASFAKVTLHRMFQRIARSAYEDNLLSV